MPNPLISFLKDEDGQAITEYILLISIVLIGATSLTRIILDALDNAILGFGGQFEKYLKTGRAPPNVWSN